MSLFRPFVRFRNLAQGLSLVFNGHSLLLHQLVRSLFHGLEAVLDCANEITVLLGFKTGQDYFKVAEFVLEA